MKNKNLFEVGIRVWDTKYGWGVVIDTKYSSSFPVAVEFDNVYFDIITYKEDGRNLPKANRTLFFEEIAIPKSALEKPKESALQMLEECEEVEFESDTNNYYICCTPSNGKVLYEVIDRIKVFGVKHISKKDAERIIKECKENN